MGLLKNRRLMQNNIIDKLWDIGLCIHRVNPLLYKCGKQSCHYNAY